jgi:glutathione peroxidase
MTPRQTILKLVYPVFTKVNKLFKKNIRSQASKTKAIESFYDLKMQLNNGQVLDFQTLRNKKVLLVNTASDCGYTPQYEGLQTLYEKNKAHLQVLGFPANDFQQQEKGDDATIEAFCRMNFNISFPLMTKSTVLKDPGQNEVYYWLTDKNKNGWNEKEPTWNFCKYLVDEEGNLTHFFESAIEPASREILNAIE